jgi:flagellar motor switch/type III secretory pathway protein FliN
METATKQAATNPQAKDTTASTSHSPDTPDPNADFGWLPCKLSLEIPLAKFTVGDLLNLSKGTILETSYHYTSDIPLRANGLLIGWTEFEVIGDRLAARITELA